MYTYCTYMGPAISPVPLQSHCGLTCMHRFTLSDCIRALCANFFQKYLLCFENSVDPDHLACS